MVPAMWPDEQNLCASVAGTLEQNPIVKQMAQAESRRVANLGQDIADVRLSGFVYGYLVPIKPVPNSDIGEGASSSFC